MYFITVLSQYVNNVGSQKSHARFYEYTKLNISGYIHKCLELMKVETIDILTIVQEIQLGGRIC